jgi:two-component system, NarL family, response regulator YdfI
VIRVLIAAPSTVVRAGLEALVASSPGLEVAGVFPDLAAYDSLRPDVVLATLLPQDEAAPPLVLLSNESAPPWTPELLRLGVRAVLPRDASAAEILAAVEAAARGFAAIDPRELETMLGAILPVATAARESVLTQREREVFGMMAEGAANKNIAWKLGISEHTVKFHVASILAKLGASSRTEAVTLGIRKGMILI